MKCGMCQKVHNHKFECDEIKALRTFCGDDEYQKKIQAKKDRKRKDYA